MFGQRFKTKQCGDVIVCEYINKDDVTVMFVNTGFVKKTTKRVLTRNHTPRLHDPTAPTVFGIGCIGVGRHKAHVKGRDTKAFSIWRAMLRRCYYLPERTAWREGTSVCDEWKNFQNFADWFEAHYPNDGGRYQLDKDIKKPNSKQYSPASCAFVTQQENLAARRFGRRRVD